MSRCAGLDSSKNENFALFSLSSIAMRESRLLGPEMIPDVDADIGLVLSGGDEATAGGHGDGLRAVSRGFYRKRKRREE